MDLELRWAGYDPDRMKTFAKELVDLRPDAILSVTTSVTGALVGETRTIPIVIVTQHRKIISCPQAAGRLPHLSGPKRI